MSWFTSWLPVLPPLPSLNISLPSSIQSRLLSFLLKKYLGHLLKPGQLDASQIDSQIGSGHVHVTDLELDSSVRALFALAMLKDTDYSSLGRQQTSTWTPCGSPPRRSWTSNGSNTMAQPTHLYGRILGEIPSPHISSSSETSAYV